MVKYVYWLLLLLDMCDVMLSIYICMWFGPTFCLVMLLFFFQKNQVGKVSFLIMQML
jgi:hypothetical protein